MSRARQSLERGNFAYGERLMDLTWRAHAANASQAPAARQHLCLGFQLLGESLNQCNRADHVLAELKLGLSSQDAPASSCRHCQADNRIRNLETW